MARFDERLLHSKALLHFEEGKKHINYEEFQAEISRLVSFAKTIKQQKNKGVFNPRLLLNSVVIAHNVFGLFANTLIVSVVDELVLPEVIVLLRILNKYPTSGIVTTVDGSIATLATIPPNEKFKMLVEKELSE